MWFSVSRVQLLAFGQSRMSFAFTASSGCLQALAAHELLGSFVQLAPRIFAHMLQSQERQSAPPVIYGISS